MPFHGRYQRTEINTPLGVIRSSIRDISTTLNQTLGQLPPFFQALPEEQQQGFFVLLNRALQKDVTLSSREARKLKRSLIEVLKEQDLKHARKIGEMLANIGVYDEIQPFIPLWYALVFLSYAYLQRRLVEECSDQIQTIADVIRLHQREHLYTVFRVACLLAIRTRSIDKVIQRFFNQF